VRPGRISPFDTFLGSPFASVDDIRPGQVVVSGGPFDGAQGAERFGARYGPDDVRSGSVALAEVLRAAEGLIDVDTGERYASLSDEQLVDVGNFTVYPTDIPRTTASLANGVYQVVKRGAFSIFLGGDHYTSYPSALGFSRAVAEQDPRARIGYVHIDGHLDFWDEGSPGQRFTHATNARRISELPEFVKSSMAWIGLTGPSADEPIEAVYHNDGVIFSAGDVRRYGPREIAERAGDHAIARCDMIYVTLDIDVLDSGLLPGTGSIDNNAITPAVLQEILTALSAYPIGAMDVMEVSPRLDLSGRSSSIAAEMAVTLARPRLLSAP
jgi:agmatinase